MQEIGFLLMLGALAIRSLKLHLTVTLYTKTANVFAFYNRSISKQQGQAKFGVQILCSVS
jgi:hypothetical protein